MDLLLKTLLSYYMNVLVVGSKVNANNLNFFWMKWCTHEFVNLKLKKIFEITSEPFTLYNKLTQCSVVRRVVRLLI